MLFLLQILRLRMVGQSQVSRRAKWRWAAARSTGTSHRKAELPCQDYYRCESYGGRNAALIAVVSDGAGSASRSQVGSFLTCRHFVRNLRAFIRAERRLPEAHEAEELVHSIRESLRAVSDKASVPVREFAATLVAAVVTRERAMTIHVGDGAVVWQQCGEWKAASWPAHGEYASTTYFVTDDKLRVRTSTSDLPVDALGLFTDGIERLVLDFTSSTPHAPFFDRMIAPVRALSRSGRDSPLSYQLQQYLSQDGVNSRTDDDKTLLLIVR
jgi:hypothetical protein